MGRGVYGPITQVGSVGSESNITLTSDGHVRVVFTGTTSLDAFFMTEENYQRLNDNQTYAYIQELSATNVTSVDMQADVPMGVYAVYWVSLGGSGNVIHGRSQYSEPPL